MVEGLGLRVLTWGLGSQFLNEGFPGSEFPASTRSILGSPLVKRRLRQPHPVQLVALGQPCGAC